MFTSLFWKDFAERLIATLAQVALGLLTADTVSGVNAKVWLTTLGVAALGVFVKAVGASKVSDTVSPASFAPAAPDLPALDLERVEDVQPEPEPVFEPVEEPVVVEAPRTVRRRRKKAE